MPDCGCVRVALPSLDDALKVSNVFDGTSDYGAMLDFNDVSAVTENRNYIDYL